MVQLMGVRRFRGLLCGLLAYLTHLFSVLVFGIPLFLFVHLPWPRIGRRCMDAISWLWFVWSEALVELLLGVRIVVHGRPVPAAEGTLIVCNHRTCLDWLFLVGYHLRCGSLDRYRLSLKQSLKNVPGIGWGMQFGAYIFLARNDWSRDKARITRSLQYYARTHTRPQFLLFPEGTDFCVKALARSRSFAEENGLPVYEHVLHPRTTGFVHFVKEMRNNRILDSVLDVTVAYPQNICHTELDLVQGHAPQEVHFLVQHFPVSELPESDDRLQEWLCDLWRQKEARLLEYYTRTPKSFAVQGDANSPVSGSKEASVRRLLWLVLPFWALFLAAVLYALLVFPWFRGYIVLASVTHVIVGHFFGGMDALLYASTKID